MSIEPQPRPPRFQELPAYVTAFAEFVEQTTRLQRDDSAQEEKV